ncbi:MAG: TonB-dependent receptor [Rhodothermales bacterium]
MPFHRIAAFLVAFLVPFAAVAQTGGVRGIVVDAETGVPLPGVNVAVEGTALGAATGKNGTYDLDAIPAGRYTLVASSLGFQAAEVVVFVRADAVTTADFALAEQPIDIGEVVVTARETLTGGPDGIRDIPGSAHYIGAERLEQFADTDIHRVLREIPGVNLQEEDGYGLRPNIGLRGSGSERSSKITVMEDGVLIAPAPYAASSAYYFPTTGRMSGVEVRKGASQIKYGPYTTGGALNLISTPIPAEFSGYAEGFVGENRARNVHAWVGNSYRNAGFVVETHVANVHGFKNLFPFEDADTGFDKQDYLAKLRLNTNPDAPVYQALTLKLSRTDEVSNETYLGLTAADFAATPYLRYAGSQEDQMNAEHRQAQLRHVAVFSERFDVTTTAYRNAFSRNWYKLDAVRDGLADDENDGEMTDAKVGIASILDSPDAFADELALVRGAFADEGRLADGVLYVKNNNRDYLSTGVQSIAGLRFDLGPAATELEVGLRIHRDEMDRFQWVDEYAMENGLMNRTVAGMPGTDSNRIETGEAVATFAQAEVAIGRLTLTPGLRYEHVTLSREDWGKSDPERTAAPETRANTVDVWIPGIAAGYQFTPALNVFAGVHRGFAPPNSTEGVEPEASVNYELGARYESDVMSAQVAGFFNDYSNLLGADLAAAGGGGTTDLFNGGSVHVGGLEVAASADLARGLGLRALGPSFALPVRLAYTYTDAAFQTSFASEFEGWGDVEAGDELPYVAHHQLAVSLGTEWDRYSFDLRGNYVGAMRTAAGSAPVETVGHTDARFVLDLAGEVKVDSRTAVFGSVRNLADEVYVVAQRPAGLRPGLPRTFLLGVRTSF